MQRGNAVTARGFIRRCRYTSYTYLSDADALAIKAYLFSLPPVRAAAPANTLAFPFNQRWAMMFWSAVFNPGHALQAGYLEERRNGIAARISRKRWRIAANATRRAISPSRSTTARNSAAPITAGWRAFNISSDKATGVGGWSDDELVAYLSIGHAKGHGTASGPMGEAVDHSLGKLAPEDIKAIVAYLRSVPAIASTDLPATTAPPAPNSHKEGHDGGCARQDRVPARLRQLPRLERRKRVSPMATLTGAWAVNDPGATNVAQIVISGTKRHTPEGALSMPAFGNAYTDDEIAAVANYVTARFGAKGSKLTAKDVAELRKQTSQ